MSQIIHVQVKPGQRQTAVDVNQTGLMVKLTAPAHDGAANEQLIEVLAEHYGVAKSTIEVIKGHTARYKTVQIEIIP